MIGPHVKHFQAGTGEELAEKVERFLSVDIYKEYPEAVVAETDYTCDSMDSSFPHHAYVRWGSLKTGQNGFIG